jgi:predicted metalloprotease with PDZ domain
VDSPVLAGTHLRILPLADVPPIRLCVAADSEAALAIPDQTLAAYRRLVTEAQALFGGHHFRSYTFLLTLSDHVQHFGLEHHESSDDRTAERALIDPDRLRDMAGLLPHELVHSWNGKYRRPLAMAPGRFDQAVDGGLLWVYEGLTQYLGDVLTARSGLLDADESRQVLALTAATMDSRKGRSWRPLQDTAVAAQSLYAARADGESWRRSVDFYKEGTLLWLEADTIIRRESKGARSLDDFCRLFHGGTSDSPRVLPYTFDDVVAALTRVQPYDWKGFWQSRLASLAPGAPLGGLRAAGWRLGFAPAAPALMASREEVDESLDTRFSLGFAVQEKDGLIPDVVPGSPADRAGVGSGMHLVAVNGRRFGKKLLREAVAATATGTPLELIVENGDVFTTVRLEWAGGARYPVLEREDAERDLLADILRPHAQP